MRYLIACRDRRRIPSGALLSIVLLLGSCSAEKLSPVDVITQGFANLDSAARSVISDPLRQENFLRSSQQLETVLRSLEKDAHSAVPEFRSAFRDYDVGKDDLAQMSAAYRERQLAASKAAVDAHRAMAASVTADEWKPLSKIEINMLEDLREAAVRSVQ